MYKLPKFELPKLSGPSSIWGNRAFTAFLIVLVSFVSGGVGGMVGEGFFKVGTRSQPLKTETIERQGNKYTPSLPQEEAVINVVKRASPSVVSIVMTKDVPKLKLYYKNENPFKDFGNFFGEPFQFKVPYYKQEGTERKVVGEGSGFIISREGLVLTNAHVVLDREADYTIFSNNGKKYPAKVLARDKVKDLALIKIEAAGKHFRPLKLGDSNNIQLGETAIAIGNALGEFRNTISVGVVSGLGRTVTAGGGGIVETQEDVIQTDAAINPGNSGGPLLNLRGEVIGVNFAMAKGAQNIGFAIPINSAKRDIEQVEKTGEIVYAFLGVRYILVNKKIQEENHLPVDYGALVVRGSKGEAAVIPGSPAEMAGIEEGDIILKLNKEEINSKNSLQKVISHYHPGDKVKLEIIRKGKKKVIEVVLGKRKG